MKKVVSCVSRLRYRLLFCGEKRFGSVSMAYCLYVVRKEEEEGGRRKRKVMSKQQPRKNEDLADDLVRKFTKYLTEIHQYFMYGWYISKCG